MFIPIANKTAKNIKKIGYVEFRIFQGWESVAAKRTYRLAPNRIVYVNRLTSEDAGLFECRLSMGNSIIIVDDLDLYKRVEPAPFLVPHKHRYKALVHFYLGLAVDEAISIAKKHSKDKILVRSSLPGIADVLFERNFIIKTGNTLETMATAEAFKGLKKL